MIKPISMVEQLETPGPFSVGDVVRIRSGSPRMTVCKVFKSEAEILWIGAGGEYWEASLPIACLDKAENVEWEGDDGKH